MQTKSILILLSLIAWGGNVSAFVTVGSDQDCDFQSLQNAIDGDEVDIRVTIQRSFSGINISKSKRLKGGYLNCEDARNDAYTGSRSVLKGGGETVVRVEPDVGTFASVVFENFNIIDGFSDNANYAGGLDIRGDVKVNVMNSKIENNVGIMGGGIAIQGNSAFLTIANTQISSNSSEQGGGIYCSDSGSVLIDKESAVSYNFASNMGGGIYADKQCVVISKAGDNRAIEDMKYGVFSNVAAEGGGVYLDRQSQMLFEGNDITPSNLIGNTAIQSDLIDSGFGGGAKVVSSIMQFVNARIEANTSVTDGSAVALFNGAEMVMERSENCRGICSSLKSNSTIPTDTNSTIVSHHSSVDVSNTLVDRNESSTSIFNMIDSELTIEGVQLSYNEGLNEQPLNSLIEVSGNDSEVLLLQTTVVNNNVNSIVKVKDDAVANLNLLNSVLWNPMSQILSLGVSTDIQLVAQCLNLNESLSLNSVADGVVEGIDLFVNPDSEFMDYVAGDFRLSLVSSGVDKCSLLESSRFTRDLLGYARVFDINTIENKAGVLDVGAYESGDLIYLSGFENFSDL